GARLEGRFDIEESIEVQCQVTGELRVGGTIVIGEQGEVSADITTVNAVILGSYTGNLKASGSIEIAATGRVSGTLESDELVIAKGGVFTGTVARPEPQPAVQVAQDEADVEPELAAQSERTTKVAKRAKPAAAPLADIAPSAQLLDLDDDVQLRAPRAQGIPIA
ncbi:MAG TPA: polymer-forming cytoskeletal protein, partial [Gemmatimonadaceae bacterium]